MQTSYFLRSQLLFLLNSLRPSDAYMRQYYIPTLVQIMACRLFDAKPLSGPMLPHCQWDPKEHMSVIFYSKFKVFIHVNALEHAVLELTAIWSRTQYRWSVYRMRSILWLLLILWCQKPAPNQMWYGLRYCPEDLGLQIWYHLFITISIHYMDMIQNIMSITGKHTS